MNKLLSIFITLIALLLILIGVTWYVQNKDSATQNSTVVYTDFTVSLPSSQSDPVTVDNFLNSQVAIPDEHNDGMYFLGNTFTTSTVNNTSPSYVILYEKETGYFNIALLQQPLTASRRDAELYLKNLLKLDATALCVLSYTLSVPAYVDEAASGIDYRFSFCPDSVSL